MSYESVEAALLTIIRKAKNFNSNNTSTSDYRVLGKGTRQAVVLSPGTFRKHVSATPRRMAWAWVVNLDLFVPFGDELSEVAIKLRSTRQDLMDIVDQYPRLDDTTGVINALVESGAEPNLWQGENRRWWVQRLRVLIEERTTVIIAE